MINRISLALFALFTLWAATQDFGLGIVFAVAGAIVYFQTRRM